MVEEEIINPEVVEEEQPVEEEVVVDLDRFDHNNHEDKVFDELPEVIVCSNFTHCTFNAKTKFDRCNLMACTFNVECEFDKSNIITQEELDEQAAEEERMRQEAENAEAPEIDPEAAAAWQAEHSGN